MTITECEIAPAQLEGLIQEFFSDIKKVCIIYEGAQEAYVLPLCDWNMPSDMTSSLYPCLRLVICDAKTELRLEKCIGAQSFVGRIIQEQEGQDFYKEDATLLFRKTSSTHRELFKHKGLINREYFQKDEDGMLVFFADRLCGVQGGW